MLRQDPGEGGRD